MAGALPLALLAGGVAAAPAAAQIDRTVAAGPLRAVVAGDPWSLRFVDEAGSTVLAEASGTSGPVGTLGFRTALGWFRATRVAAERREGPAYVATLATTDPTGRTLEVRVAPDADGVVAVETTVGGDPGGVQATGISFVSRDGERHLGFGERSNAVDQRGREVESFVSDGPYQPEERPFVAALVPAAGFRFRDDATYFPIPWLLSTAGYGVLVDDDTTTMHRLGTDRPDAWSVETAAARLRLRVFAGPRPADVLGRMSERLGRQPKVASPFFFGPWVQGKGTLADNLATLEKAGAPTSVWQTYTHYLPCADQTGKTAAERERNERIHAAGLAVTTYFNPMICTNHPRYGEAVAKGVLTKTADGRPYEYRYQGSTQFNVGQIDFSAPGADAFFASLLAEAVADGHDGWMEDFGEYTPQDAVSADGTPGPEMHNRYVELYHRSAWRYSEKAGRPLARFNRSGWTGAARSSQIVWGGDPTTDWGFDGLRSTVWQGLTMGLSGVSMWGSDVGGFFELGARKLTPELLARWIEVGFASGVMRTQANGFQLPAKARPQIFDPEMLPIWTRYARLRTQLYPYLAAAQAEYDRSGLPIMRHLALAEPEDPRAVVRDDEYLLGPDLFVAPVVAPGARERRTYVPRGAWIDLWRSATLTEGGSPALGAVREIEGGRDATLPAPLDELPLLVRVGAVLPLLPADVRTLAAYGAGKTVRLADRKRQRTLVAFPRGATRGDLGVRERWSSLEGRRRWTLRIEGRLRRTYRIQASLRTLRRPFRPCAVSAGGERISRKAWSYDRATGVLRATVRGGRFRVLVRGC